MEPGFTQEDALRVMISEEVPKLVSLLVELVPDAVNHRITINEPQMVDANGDNKTHVVDAAWEARVERVVPGLDFTVQVEYRADPDSKYFNIVTRPVVPLCDPYFLRSYVVPHCAQLINHVISTHKKEQ